MVSRSLTIPFEARFRHRREAPLCRAAPICGSPPAAKARRPLPAAGPGVGPPPVYPAPRQQATLRASSTAQRSFPHIDAPIASRDSRSEAADGATGLWAAHPIGNQGGIRAAFDGWGSIHRRCTSSTSGLVHPTETDRSGQRSGGQRLSPLRTNAKRRPSRCNLRKAVDVPVAPAEIYGRGQKTSEAPFSIIGVMD